MRAINQRAVALVATSTVVDVTPIYENVKANAQAWGLYEDSVVRPPWLDASFCYEQHDGSVLVAHCAFLPIDGYTGERWQPNFAYLDNPDAQVPGSYQPPLGEGQHSLDWSRVAWVGQIQLWGSVPRAHAVAGPLHAIRLAIDADGTILDLSWVQTRPDIGINTWDSPLVVILSSLTFLNCRNVTIVEPTRPRAHRRRIERAAPGVRISEIRVFGRGVSVAGRPAEPGDGGVPLHSVRGHVAHYGCHGRSGLLFGKHRCEVWVPFHARGSIDYGEVEQSYTLEGEAS